MKNGRKLTNSAMIALIALTVILIAAATGLGTYAAYTSSKNAQRTIATYDTEGERFSSNFLEKTESKENVRTVYVTDTSVNPSSIITVQNYARGKQAFPNANDITYSVLVRLVYFDSATDALYVPATSSYMTENSLTAYSVTVTIGNTTVTLSSSHLSDETLGGTLAGGPPVDSDSYTLTFVSAFAANQPNLYVEMIVTPTGLNLQPLRGIFKTAVRAQSATNAWSGAFTDDTSAALPSVYDGFNYRLSGSGSLRMTLSWNDSLVGINPLSMQTLLSLADATPNQAGNSITFRVNSDDASIYDLQFYKQDATDARWSTMTWATMNSSVVQFTAN